MKIRITKETIVCILLIILLYVGSALSLWAAYRDTGSRQISSVEMEHNAS